MALAPFLARHGLIVNTNMLVVNSSTGRVGIGTTAPTTQLHVVGGGLLTGSVTIGGDLTVNGNTITNATSFTVGSNVVITADGLFVGNSTVNSTVNSTALTVADADGAISLQAPTSSQIGDGTFFLNANGSWSEVSSLTAGGSNGQVQFNDGDLLGGSAAFTFDKTTNNVAIGNTVVIGTSSIVNSTSVSVNQQGNSTVNAALFAGILPNSGISFIEMGGSNTVFIDFKSPNSDDYDYRLGSNGSHLVVDSNTSSSKVIMFRSSNVGFWANLTVAYPELFIDSINGRIGIGTDAPNADLQVNGAANVSGAVTLGSTLSVTGATLVGNSTVNAAINSTSIAFGNSTTRVVIGNNATGARWVSTSPPSGGADGDVWYQTTT